MLNRFSDEMNLSDALRAVPVPQTSSDFNGRVLAELHRPQPWWRNAKERLWLLITGSCCSIALASALLQYAGESARIPTATNAGYAICQKLLDTQCLPIGLFAWLLREACIQWQPGRLENESNPASNLGLHPTGSTTNNQPVLLPA